MADPHGTPTYTTDQVSTLEVGPGSTIPVTPVTPSVAPAPPPVPGSSSVPGAVSPYEPAGSTDPINGIGMEGEETVWVGGYSIRNFFGRIVTRTALAIAWIVLAIYTWGYDHDNLQLLAIISGIAVLILVVGLVFRIIQTQLGHKYRLTTRRLFISTGVLRRERDQMELLRIRDVYERQTSLMERWLGTGTVVIVSSDKSLPNFHILGVAEPKRVMDLVWHHARAEQDQRNVKVESV